MCKRVDIVLACAIIPSRGSNQGGNMKKTIIPVALLVAVSVFSASPPGDVHNYDSPINRAEGEDFRFSEPSGPGNFRFGSRAGHDIPRYLQGSIPQNGGESILLDAGDAFGLWTTRELFPDPGQWVVGTVMSLQGRTLTPNHGSFSYINLTLPDGRVCGYGHFQQEYVSGSGATSQRIVANLHMNWLSTPAAPSGQPLPGVLIALAVGGGAYVVRRRRLKA